MIKLILSGGLGNQMFQYAAAKALSLRLGCNMSVDLHMFHKNSKATLRDYELDVFGLDLPVTSSIKNKLCTKTSKYLTRYFIGKELLRQLRVFKDSDSQCYSENFSLLDADTVLFGYFQNEKYFQNYSNQIRSDFSFKRKLDRDNTLVKNNIENSNSVSLHIRRGDYLNTNSNLEILDMAYYQEAVNLVKKQIENPVFFIFSDDMDWVKKHLDEANLNCVYVDFNRGKSSYIDLQLISCCKHNVMANSTFSWWGAWLNNNPQKLVIAPPVWYKNQSKINYPEGFIPQAWTII